MGKWNNELPCTCNLLPGIMKSWSSAGFLGYNLIIFNNYVFALSVCGKWNPIFPFGSFPSLIQLFLSFCANWPCGKFTFYNIAWWIKDVSWSLAKCPGAWILLMGQKCSWRSLPIFCLYVCVVLVGEGWTNNVIKFRVIVIKNLTGK